MSPTQDWEGNEQLNTRRAGWLSDCEPRETTFRGRRYGGSKLVPAANPPLNRPISALGTGDFGQATFGQERAKAIIMQLDLTRSSLLFGRFPGIPPLSAKTL